MLRRRASVLLLLVGVGCSLTNLDGLSGGAPESDAGGDAPPDVGPTSPGAADGGSEAGPGDA
ncbi:MAG: hypothetical protein KC657_39185, partial [Myxococcales bacterium]|nr:hypothetical protein [Myxococcales bacterium]